MRHEGRPRLGPFRHRAFLIYWICGFISNVGTFLQAVAVSVYVYAQTGSALAVGVLNFASFLPFLLFSLIGGVIGDRYDRRKVVVATHTISGAVACLLAALVFSGEASQLSVILVAFVLNSIFAVAKPAMVAIFPAIVSRSELPDAVSLNSLQFVIASMVGPIVAVAIIAAGGFAWAFALNATSYMAPILAMAYLWRRGLAAGPAATGPGRSDLGQPAVAASRAEGQASALTYVRDHHWVLAILVGIVACYAPLEIVRTLSPAIAEELADTEVSAGFLIAAQSLGMAIGLGAFVPLHRRRRSQAVARTGLGIEAIGLLGIAMSGQFWTAGLFACVQGFGFSLCFSTLTSQLQAAVPDALRGRIMAFHQMAHHGNRPIAALAAGVAATALGPQPAVAIGLVLIPFGYVAASRALRALDVQGPARRRQTDAYPNEPDSASALPGPVP